MIRFGIVGIGAIAQNYIEIIQSKKVKNVQITALSSRNESHMQEITKQYKLEHAKLFVQYEEMLQSGCIDAVMICTPHFLHPSMAESAIKYGIHPLIEKPIGVYSEEVFKMMGTAKQYPNIHCGVLYCRRTSQAFCAIKQMLEEGRVGELKRVNWMITNLYRTEAYHHSSPWRGTYQGEGGGILMTQASHQLDLFLWLCSMPERVNAFCYMGMERQIQVENDVTLQMEFKGGATGQFIASSREFPGTNRLEISGEKGQLILEQDCHLTYHQLEMGEKEYSKNTKEFFGKIPYKTYLYDFEEEDNQKQQSAMIQNFADAIQTDTKPICTLEEAMHSLEVINAAYLSAWLQKSMDVPFDYKVFTEELQKRF